MTKEAEQRPGGIAFRYEGRRIEAPPGATVAAALAAAGEYRLRTTRSGERRGIFCGMGVCHDCLVGIDGVGGQRACMTIARDGMEVVPQPRLAQPGVAPAQPHERILTPDLFVIGGGPAGLSAASVAAEAGLDVVLADERPKLGGQYYKQPAHMPDEALPDDQFRKGRALIRRVERAGVHSISGALVWDAAGPGELAVAGADLAWSIRPKRLILATGAYERGVPMPGWTLPGYMTTGAAQTLLRSHGVVAGRRILVAGNGPLNMQVAAELVRAGATVVALCELADAPGLHSAGHLVGMAAASPALVRKGLGYRRTLRRAMVPVLHRHTVIRAEGDGRVERAVVAAIDAHGHAVPGSERTFAVDAVCAGFSFLPSNEIARALGCAHYFDARRRHLMAKRDARGRSTVEGVWIVGDGGGLEGAHAAAARGVLAGIDAATDLGRTIPGHLEREATRAAIRLRGSLRFQEALWSLFRAPAITDQLASPDTVICRCEEVTLAHLQEALDGELVHAGAIKRVTRAGMGHCQGRYCASLVAELAARRTGREMGEAAFFAPRAPFKPVSVASIAALADPDQAPLTEP